MPQCVYRLTFAGGKTYVGSTVSLNNRLCQHARAARNGSMLAVHCAWRKHGEPSADVLEVVASAEYLQAAEQRWLDELRPWAGEGRGYNMSRRADRPDSEILAATLKARWSSKEARVARSAEVRAMWNEPGFRERAVPNMRAAQSKPEVCARKSRVGKGRSLSEEARAKISAAAIARASSDEERSRRSDAARRRWADPEWRARVVEKIRSAANSTESRRASSERARSQWADPEMRRRMSGPKKRRAPAASQPKAPDSLIPTPPATVEKPTTAPQRPRRRVTFKQRPPGWRG